MPDLLFEIGLEEVPARMLASAEAELARRLAALLELLNRSLRAVFRFAKCFKNFHLTFQARAYRSFEIGG